MRPPGQSLPMGVDIGGPHTHMGPTTILMLRRTVAVIIMAAMAIIMPRLTIIPLRELTVGNKLLTARTDPPPGELVTIPTRAPMREAARCRHLTAPEVRRRRIIRIPELMHRPDKVRVPQLSGAVHTCRGEIKVPQWVITQLRTAPWPGFQGRKAERPPARARPGEIPQPVKPPAAICTRGMMAMFTRTPATDGKNTTTEAGIL